ncbi:unnamed protein product [Paramecium pentaurelia]|uniref:Transmembrane protein n=1 Tax=Paramecium pentaurelia TaxID=43138 RepID=A0A8S1U567_9CILI|nr:unnamed protein product [Paramecium pentaurelia]
MLLIIMIFGFQIFQINSKACEIQKIQSKITCYQLVQDCFILEGNEEDYYKLKHIDKEIVQKLFSIPYRDIPIQTKILKSFDQEKIQQKLICQLFLNQQYYIKCIKFDILNNEKNENELEVINLRTNIIFEESCDEFYQLDSENLILFCMSQFTLKQYSINLQGDVILMFEYDVSIQIQDKCNKKQFKLLEKNQLIIVFFNCFQWKILYLNNQQINIVLESKMKENNHNLLKLKKIDNVQFCQINSLNLFLIEGNNYLQIIWEQN